MTAARVYLVILAIGVSGFAPLYGVAPSTTVPWVFGAPAAFNGGIALGRGVRSVLASLGATR